MKTAKEKALELYPEIIKDKQDINSDKREAWLQGYWYRDSGEYKDKNISPYDSKSSITDYL